MHALPGATLLFFTIEEHIITTQLRLKIAFFFFKEEKANIFNWLELNFSVIIQLTKKKNLSRYLVSWYATEPFTPLHRPSGLLYYGSDFGKFEPRKISYKKKFAALINDSLFPPPRPSADPRHNDALRKYHKSL